MKIKYSNGIGFLVVAYLLSSCNVRIPSEDTPNPKYYGLIDQVRTVNGFPSEKEPWVVISDRENNTVFMKKGDEKSPKQIKFLEPLIIVQRKSSKGLVKVAEYNPDALLKKLPKSSIKSYGWIPEDQLLLWTNAIKNEENGFAVKASVVPNHSDVIKDGEKYLKNDSVIVFTSPDLTKAANIKLPVGQLVYIYKQANDQKRFLIGKSPSVKIDSIAGNMYGWVSSNMIGIWGDRTALRVSSEYSYDEDNNLGLSKDVTDGKTENSYFKITEAQERTPVENLIGTIPAEMGKGNKARFFSNALDYSKNYVYNVLGEPLYFNRYKEITTKNKTLNLVFTLDVSNENVQNSAVAKSAFQDLQLKLKDLKFYKNIQFGAVLYKNNTCGDNVVVSELTSNFDLVSKFIDLHTAQNNCSSYGGQPMQEGLAAAGELLIPHKDNTNVIVLVGSTASFGGNFGNAVRSISEARAKIISYQTVSGSSDNYNNFVLLSENLVTNTGKNIAELEKARSIDQNSIMNRNNYNLQSGVEGVYSLDYPKSSMTQGFVIYPKKGEVNSNTLLARSIDSLLVQVTHQNRHNDKMLTEYFKSAVGANKTEVREDFRPQFSNAPVIVPVATAAQLVTYNYPFLIKGSYTDDFKEYYPAVQKGVLISEQEYDKLRNLYMEIYKETMPFSPSFSQSKAVNSYLTVLKKYNTTVEKFRKGKIENKSMAYSVAKSTGFDNAGEEVLSKYMLKGWRNPKIIPETAVKAYFTQYKILADRMLDNKRNPKILVEQNGEVFYFLNKYFMPLITPSETL